jgi:hypothetical protein
MVSAQWEEALSPLSSNPALFEDGCILVILHMIINNIIKFIIIYYHRVRVGVILIIIIIIKNRCWQRAKLSRCNNGVASIIAL